MVMTTLTTTTTAEETVATKPSETSEMEHGSLFERHGADLAGRAAMSRFLEHILDTLDAMEVPPELSGELMDVVGSLRSQIVLTRAVPNAYPR